MNFMKIHQNSLKTISFRLLNIFFSTKSLWKGVEGGGELVFGNGKKNKTV